MGRCLAHGNSQESLRVSWAEIERMASAAAVIDDCRRELAARNRNIVSEALADNPAAEWQHYPDGEVYDPKSHAQYFYHTHPVSGGPVREHGHFHTFLRAEGMPVGAAPLILPEIAVADWKAADKCAKQAQAAYPDYSAEANAKRDAKLKECLSGGNLAPRQPVSQPPPR